jgi:predicted RND superfamily exporter protein
MAGIAVIILKLSVDDTVHSMHYYQRRGGHRGATIAHVGPAIVLTGAMLLSGKSFMLLDCLKTVQLFGLLATITVVGAMFGELLVFRLVLAWFDPKPQPAFPPFRPPSARL